MFDIIQVKRYKYNQLEENQIQKLVIHQHAGLGCVLVGALISSEQPRS